MRTLILVPLGFLSVLGLGFGPPSTAAPSESSLVAEVEFIAAELDRLYASDDCPADCNGPFICGTGRHETHHNSEGGTAQPGDDAGGAYHGCGSFEGGCGANHGCEPAQEEQQELLADLQERLGLLNPADLVSIASMAASVHLNMARSAIQVENCAGDVVLHVSMSPRQVGGLGL